MVRHLFYTIGDLTYLSPLIHTCAVSKRLATPSDFHIPLPSVVPFAHS